MWARVVERQNTSGPTYSINPTLETDDLNEIIRQARKYERY
jgi:hypothetical protein